MGAYKFGNSCQLTLGYIPYVVGMFTLSACHPHPLPSPQPPASGGSLFVDDTEPDLEGMIAQGIAQYARHGGTRVLPVFIITLAVSTSRVDIV